MTESLDQLVEDLSLILIYLTAWEEKVLDERFLRSWKGYPFEVLDKLAAEGYIFTSRRSRSVHLTQSGIEKAETLKRSYNL